ncbi:hypothetical protein [Bacillus sp. PS06]|uniref:hypothetical protein n=1 Tax=Bacillus sp. PS06 TaxID=2764176 RepID=UPI00177C5CE7|nr:hypothetical protein [Bacillus sp. PS06]MBD8070642.1 hypothetical protein [Bacillus sp. PS06]
MRAIYFFVGLVSIALLVGCQMNQEETMVLLDEKVIEVNVSKSNGFGDMNFELLHSFNDKKSIQVFEKAIRNATLQEMDFNPTQPDFDVMVEYKDGLPTHAIHLWLGEEDETSILMYMIGEGETYVTSSKTTNQLRELLISE